ncbi:MAG: S-methyl-5-thioribose-1-phosphate isomerase [Candidatus Omnitrophica bacterium]|nr:S-methyl-5-thioribose-1-phosphate isomerase [Candidatus Omnitrophota bacterium]
MVSIKFKNNKLFYIDQTMLPEKEVWRKCSGLSSGFRAIKDLEIRGAPLIGVFAALCLYTVANDLTFSKGRFLKYLDNAINKLKSSRPTAVNLFWALDRIKGVIDANKNKDVAQIKKAILKEAQAICNEDVKLCHNMGEHGAKLVNKGDKLLTHCNAGSLATAGSGTALAVFYRACAQGKKIKVYADETRPLLQGGRLTMWELQKHKVDCTLICDNMAAFMMQKGEIDKVFLGADRIAANGDAANKIGTYSVAISAKYHKIPFYVVAPFSTFDLTLKTGESIPIEERKPLEVQTVLGKMRIAPNNAKVRNPAFDVTPNKLITAIVTDRGVIYPPFAKNIKKILG